MMNFQSRMDEQSPEIARRLALCNDGPAILNLLQEINDLWAAECRRQIANAEQEAAVQSKLGTFARRVLALQPGNEVEQTVDRRNRRALVFMKAAHDLLPADLYAQIAAEVDKRIAQTDAAGK